MRVPPPYHVMSVFLNKFFNLCRLFFCLLMDGHPEHSVTLTNATPFLKLEDGWNVHRFLYYFCLVWSRTRCTLAGLWSLPFSDEMRVMDGTTHLHEMLQLSSTVCSFGINSEWLSRFKTSEGICPTCSNMPVCKLIDNHVLCTYAFSVSKMLLSVTSLS
jgi:hypothetical protein